MGRVALVLCSIRPLTLLMSQLAVAAERNIFLFTCCFSASVPNSLVLPGGERGRAGALYACFVVVIVCRTHSLFASCICTQRVCVGVCGVRSQHTHTHTHTFIDTADNSSTRRNQGLHSAREFLTLLYPLFPSCSVLMLVLLCARMWTVSAAMEPGV